LQILENSGRYWDTSIYQYLYQYCRYVPVLQILEDTGKILVLPVLCTSIVIPVSRPAASYYPENESRNSRNGWIIHYADDKTFCYNFEKQYKLSLLSLILLRFDQ
jgi:hypothetical protein